MSISAYVGRRYARTVLDRVRDHGDLFAGVLATTQELPPVS
jgi:hypothetical protein